VSSRLVLSLLVIVFLVNTLAYAQDSLGNPIDCIVYFVNPDGWTILAKDGQQIAKEFVVRVYVREPGNVKIELILNGKKISEYSEYTDFYIEKSFKVTSEGGLDIRIRYESKAGSYTLVKSYTVAAKPTILGKNIVVYGVKQFERMIENLKAQTIMLAGVFALAGVLGAVIIKYVFKLLGFANGLQLVFNGCILALATLVDPELGFYYWLVAFISDIITYYAVAGPKMVAILKIPRDSNNVTDVMLPIYQAPNGKLAVALQTTKHAIDRVFRNKHVFFETKGKQHVQWVRNGKTPLYFARDAVLVKEDNEEKMVVELMDVHDIAYMHNIGLFEKLKKYTMELLEENRRLRSTLELSVEEAKIKVLQQLAKLGGKRLWGEE